MPTGDFDLKVPSGTIRAHRFGDPSASAIICVHGLSSNSRAFGFLGNELARNGQQVIALDLRGRGFSDKTGAGTYGWRNHARDIFHVADALGLDTFDVMGHSMGAFVGMQAAAIDKRGRIQRLVLIDGLGWPSLFASHAIGSNLASLARVYRSADEYVAQIQRLNLVKPWNEHWERHFRYELLDVPGGVRARTQYFALYEDTAHAMTHPPRALWSSLRIPVLVLRATRPLVHPDGFVITVADRDRFIRSTPSATVEEIDANHFGILMEADSAAAIEGFLSPGLQVA